MYGTCEVCNICGPLRHDEKYGFLCDDCVYELEQMENDIDYVFEDDEELEGQDDGRV